MVKVSLLLYVAARCLFHENAGNLVARTIGMRRAEERWRGQSLKTARVD
jgi:hypothetical protein